MALTPRLERSSTTSNPSNPPAEHIPPMTNSDLNKYSIDTTEYSSLAKDIAGFMRGKRTIVTYYRLLNREQGNNRTNIVDLPTSRNVLSTEYQKIEQLEITLPKEFDFTVNNEAASMSISGSAMMYPNMNPNIGDLFTMATGDGRYGICRISLVSPMTWRTDSVWMVNFTVHEFVTHANHDPTEGAVTVTSVFDKENYLGGTAALLSQKTYLYLQKLKSMRRTLCRYYHDAFFDRSLSSYVRPDNIYDPCVVKYMTNKISSNDLVIRPKNLLGQIPDIYKYSIWARLEDNENRTLHFVRPHYSLSLYRQTKMGVFMTELIGRTILLPSEDLGPDSLYLFSNKFYTGAVGDMTGYEKLVYNAITQRAVGDLGTLVNSFLDLTTTLPTEEQFYRIPVYIHLIDMALLPQYREADAPTLTASDGGH